VAKEADMTKTELVRELAKTRQKVGELEEALRISIAKLKQSREEYKTFAYIVSHDLRNPLINLKGFAAELGYALETVQAVVDGLLPQLEEKQRQAVTVALQEDIPESLGFIESSVKRIDEFMNAVLKLSRLGRRPLKLEPVDMDAVVREVLALLADQMEENQVVATVAALPEVVGDRASLMEVMEIVLKNAVVYTEPGKPGHVEVVGKQGSDETIIYVRDDGRGIEEADLHKVFEPFRRAGRQDVPGDGMGLAYAQALIRRHGGRVLCESELGVGTTFTLTISRNLDRGDDHGY